MPRRRRNRNKNKTQVMGFTTIPFPRPLKTSLEMTHTFRYICTGGLAANTNTVLCKDDDLIQILAVPTVSSTTVASAVYKQLISSYRIKRVQVWVAGLAGFFDTITLRATTDADGIGAHTEEHCAVSVGVDKPAYIDWRPKPNSDLAMWFDEVSPNENLITLVSNALVQGEVMADITLDFVWGAGYSATAINATGFATSAAAIAVGTMTFLPLNSTTATTQALAFMPVGMPVSTTLRPNT